VPSFCELHADFRFPPAISLKKFLEEVLKATEAHRTCHPDVELEVEVEDSCEPYEADRNSILVRGLAWAVTEVRGKRATLLRKTGTGDMNVLGAKLGVPMVTYGPGNSKLDHTEDECMDLNEYLDSIKILQKGLARTLDLHNKLNKK
jgi:LysW-gamma-L-lysine carboxypeptidase